MIFGKSLDLGVAADPNAGGSYSDPGDPLQNVKKVGSKARNIIEIPILVVALSYIYEAAILDGNPNRNWATTDLVAIVLVAWFISRSTGGVI